MNMYVHQKFCSRMFAATLFLIAPNGNNSHIPSTAEWINKLCHIHKYATMKMNKLLVQKPWRNLTNRATHTISIPKVQTQAKQIYSNFWNNAWRENEAFQC